MGRTVMSSRSLSSIVRGVLMAEGVEVDLPVFGMRPSSYDPGNDAGDMDPHWASDPRWREDVMNRFSFLDAHRGVGDVQVRPVVLDDVRHMPSIIARALGDGSSGGVLVVDAQEGEDLLRQIGVASGGVTGVKDIQRSALTQAYSEVGPDAEMALTDNITIVPIMGRQSFSAVNLDSLPGAEGVVVSIFDSASSLGLPQTSSLISRVRSLVAREADTQSRGGKLCVGALVNSSWGSRLFERLISSSDQDTSDALDREADDISSVMGSASEYAAQILTLAAVDPRGFMPVGSRILRLPPWALRHDYGQDDTDAKVSDFTVDTQREHIRLLLADLRAISKEVGGGRVRDALAQDLVGKVIFVRVR